MQNHSLSENPKKKAYNKQQQESWSRGGYPRINCLLKKKSGGYYGCEILKIQEREMIRLCSIKVYRFWRSRNIAFQIIYLAEVEDLEMSYAPLQRF